MAKNEPGTAVAVTADTSPYLPALIPEPGEMTMAQVIAENTGSEGINRFSLTPIKIPSGGTQAWTVPTLLGPEVEKELEGIIVWFTPSRGYWPQAYGEGGGGSPPQCASSDGLIGVGNPGGSCHDCHLNQYETAEKGRGKACKEMRQVFLLLPGSLLPVRLQCSPASIAPFKNYMLTLANSALAYHRVVSAIALTAERNSDGMVYSKIVPRFVRKLIPEEVAALNAKMGDEPKEDELDERLSYREALIGALREIVLTEQTNPEYDGDPDDMPFE